jgi:putative nucleotidyltransferase with HDIG domain
MTTLLADSCQPDTALIPVKLCNLPPFHSAAAHLLSLQEDPELDSRRITVLVRGDPALAAEVLFLANSSLFGFPSRIQGLHHAIALLGLERVKALAMTVATRALLGRGGPLVDQCWQHSAACAVVAAEISSFFDVSEDSAYTAALLHDIGRLGLLRSYAGEYGAILADEFDSLEEVLKAESEVFQIDHSVAGSWLVGYWSFPSSFIEICERHHEPVGEQDSPLLRVVKIACSLADALGHAAVRCKHNVSYRHALETLSPELASALPSEEQFRRRVNLRLSALDR